MWTYTSVNRGHGSVEHELVELSTGSSICVAARSAERCELLLRPGSGGTNVVSKTLTILDDRERAEVVLLSLAAKLDAIYVDETGLSVAQPAAACKQWRLEY